MNYDNDICTLWINRMKKKKHHVCISGGEVKVFLYDTFGHVIKRQTIKARYNYKCPICKKRIKW